MLSSQIIGPHKLVLFIDDVGMERNSTKLIERMLKEHNVNYNLLENLDSENDGIIILPPLSKLEVKHNDSVIEIIHGLKINKSINQIFIWATSKNISNRLLVPFLEHIADIVVIVRSAEVLSILTKRKFGTIKMKEYQHELLQGKTSIKELKVDKQKLNEEEPIAYNENTVGTSFKIGDFSESEQEARKGLKLPFELM